MGVASRSNVQFVLAHREELQVLPNGEFMYRDIDLDYSLFRQCTERELLVQVDEVDGRAVWRKNGVDEVLNSDR